MEYSSVVEHLHGHVQCQLQMPTPHKQQQQQKKTINNKTPSDLKSRVKNANTGLRNMDTDCNIF